MRTMPVSVIKAVKRLRTSPVLNWRGDEIRDAQLERVPYMAIGLATT